MPTTTFPLALAPLPDTSSSTSALYLRLGLLEDLLSQPTQLRIPDETTINSKKGDVDVPPRPGQDLTSRLEALERGLQDLIRGSGSGSGKEGLRRFVDRFDSIQVLLRHVPDPRTTTPTLTSITSNTAINTTDSAGTQPGNSVDANLDPSFSTTTAIPAISTETKLSLVLPSSQTLLAIPAQYTALRALLDRGVDGAGELDRYFSGPPGGSSSRKVGGAAENVSDDNKEKVENGVEREEQVDVGQRIRAIRRTLDTRNFGTMPSVPPKETQSVGPKVGNTMRREEVGDGDAAGHEEGKGARAQNLRRVGEVLGRWDAFVSPLFRSTCVSFSSSVFCRRLGCPRLSLQAGCQGCDSHHRAVRDGFGRNQSAWA
ncbi:hypothetical protein HD553DRAFT_22750 [Filobasidium floriforme]|uniref:uncharacterized protein n=1 Tax=Filobasidium floriforme TaxID=5210 RepID=UPI001E8CB5D5|nr:uncharacterized protein HD553DRAFT_22750 [Filobasidium floriforme]KAH8085161.1 hypothetical protein HD553DRAFT_22750 [Filobasidium floriforme]